MQIVTPDRLQEWVPGKLLLSSDRLGWQSVGLRSWAYAAQDVMVPPLSDFMLVAYRTGTTPMRRSFGGAWKNEHMAPGTISLLTRAQSAKWAWDRPITVTHLYLTPAMITSIASEMVDAEVSDVTMVDLLRAEDPMVTMLVETITAEAGQNGLGGALYVESLTRALCVHLLRRYSSIRARSRPDNQSLSPRETSRINDYIDANLAEPLTLAGMAAAVGLTPHLFARRFRASFGLPAYRHVMLRRLERARRLLAETPLSVKEIAAQCGFADQAHLTRLFAREMSVTPARFRKER